MAKFNITKTKNRNFHAAKAAKNDEFYTREEDIENELRWYRPFFKNKVVYCNCDDPTKSMFFQYFKKNFNRLELKQLITTCYQDSEKGICLIYDGSKDSENLPLDEEIIKNCSRSLEGDGDFRSEECIELLKEADIVVTNPPFSLFREYLLQLLLEFEKKFLIIGNMGAVQYKQVWPYFMKNKVWLGVSPRSMRFEVSTESSEKKFVDVNAVWFTNLEHDKRNEGLRLWKEYTPEEYPKYDNFDAIEVSRVSRIPVEYGGLMGVPITFLDKYSPSQFQIIGTARELTEKENGKQSQFFLNGKELYTRIVIKKI